MRFRKTNFYIFLNCVLFLCNFKVAIVECIVSIYHSIDIYIEEITLKSIDVLTEPHRVYCRARSIISHCSVGCILDLNTLVLGSLLELVHQVETLYQKV